MSLTVLRCYFQGNIYAPRRREPSEMHDIFQSVYNPSVPVTKMLIIPKNTRVDIQYVHTPTHADPVTSQQVEQMLCSATRFDQNDLSLCSTKSLQNTNMPQFSQ